MYAHAYAYSDACMHAYVLRMCFYSYLLWLKSLCACVVYSLRLFVYSRQLCYLAVPFVGLVHGPES